jgi:Family of unknown function (DUF6510)
MTEFDQHLDGNALGGMLADVFGREMTAAVGTCSACGSVNAFGAAIAYTQAPGEVLRCPGCGIVLMVFVHRPDGYLITFGSIRCIEVAE